MLGLELNLPEKNNISAHPQLGDEHPHSDSIIAFSLLNIAALASHFTCHSDQQLKAIHPKRFIQSLPSLQTMESLLFQMLAQDFFS